ncbi:PAS domain-containing protein [Phycicoccus sp. MAQZ13P-2]|uniref:PAS domain-containing protein n=1 Tax=Phycicoccus mangrovi TaxID=2840470 RepID=UPI001C0003B0|nr:PAS domain-containing protein [Phycicoccus mangrovi]MBT9255562.1 PAS domain-containing protein [Phycicoccus mangrovi]MBT9275276.1 PAS domain-containing protein [Phycicoccus mangrovi]
MTRTTPSGVERTFGRDEIIVTKTDLQGRITYANEVFCRVSAFDEADVLGKPHNIIRHPSMPAGVFKLLWDRLQAGQELFAYVVNMAGDGGHYWVFAHVTPTFDARGSIIGYHSNRRVPSRSALNVIEPLYREIRSHEASFGRATEASAGGLAFLHERLEQLGMTYDEWVWSLATEVAA